MIVDTHTHVFPPEIVNDRKFFLKNEPEFEIIYGNKNASLVTAEDLLKVMKVDKIDISWILGFPWMKEENARLHNDYIIAMIKKNPLRFRGFCCVHPSVEWGPREVERCFGLGIHGLGEMASYNSDLNIDFLSRYCVLCERAEKPFLLHTNEPIGHAYVGKAPITLLALYSLIKLNQKTKFILAHMAGGLFFYSILRKEVNFVLNNVWIDTAAVPFLYNPEVYHFAIRLLGRTKVLFGSDFPLLRLELYRRSMIKAGLFKEDIESIMNKSALKLIL